jgi:hypothetical protein
VDSCANHCLRSSYLFDFLIRALHFPAASLFEVLLFFLFYAFEHGLHLTNATVGEESLEGVSD